MLEICKRHASTSNGRIRLGICMSVIFVVAMVFGLLVIAKPYAVYATGEKVSDPWVVKSNGKEVAVVESKEAGESVVTGVKATYIKGVIEQQEADVLEDITVEKYRFDDASTHPVVMTTPEAVEHIVGLNEKSDAPLQIATSEVVTEQVAIPYTEETMDSDNYFVGETALWSAGVDGSKEVVSEVKLVNGKEVARKELSSTVIQEAIPNVVMVGTKPVPAAAPAATSTKSSSKSSGSSSVSYNVPSSGNGSAVASFALQFVGNPYVYGGTSLTNGADCSGFTMAVYAQFGISLPHSSYAQEGYGVSVPLSQAAPGDLVCYGSHIGIYIGNGQMVHASTPSGGIKVSPINYRPVSAIKRLI